MSFYCIYVYFGQCFCIAGPSTICALKSLLMIILSHCMTSTRKHLKSTSYQRWVVQVQRYILHYDYDLYPMYCIGIIGFACLTLNLFTIFGPTLLWQIEFGGVGDVLCNFHWRESSFERFKTSIEIWLDQYRYRFHETLPTRSCSEMFHPKWN
jgi:hypothetical protein